MSYNGAFSIAGGKFEQALNSNKQVDNKYRFIMPSYRNTVGVRKFGTSNSWPKYYSVGLFLRILIPVLKKYLWMSALLSRQYFL
jgi:hypothetical protein